MPKKTPFYDMHVKHGGKIVEFAGYLMPIQFEGIIPEHKTVRTSVGVFDVSHMGEIEIRGADRLAFVNHLITNDASALQLNQIQYAAMLYSDGGIVDDLLVYNLKDRILLVVNAANVDKDHQWIVDNKKYDITIENKSEAIGQLAVQGPDAEKVVKSMCSLDVSSIQYYWAAETHLDDIPVLLSRTGYTGEDGFEIYCDRQYALQVWQKVFDAGAEHHIKPIGLGARDTLRFEMRYCLYGNDIDKTTNPLEAGLSWIVKFDKGDFIGKEALLAIKEAGITRRLVGFAAIEKGIPRPHQEIHIHGANVGHVTSGTFSPSLKKGLGMGYVAKPHDKIGTKLTVVGKQAVEVEIVKGAFYKKASHK
jgi:aminomethyltransferase